MPLAFTEVLGRLRSCIEQRPFLRFTLSQRLRGASHALEEVARKLGHDLAEDQRSFPGPGIAQGVFVDPAQCQTFRQELTALQTGRPQSPNSIRE